MVYETYKLCLLFTQYSVGTNRQEVPSKNLFPRIYDNQRMK